MTMIEAPSLFDPPPVASARKNATVTELAGARKASVREGSKRARILAELAFQPLTDNELCRRLDPNPTDPASWPGLKSCRSRLVHKHKEVVGTGYMRDGQEVWRRVDRPEHARVLDTQPI
jgi:hypothetical protein